MSLRKQIEDTGSGSDSLAAMAELLGYKESGRFAINQLQFNNGAFASSLLHFLDDNPGAGEALVQWVLDHGCTKDGESLDLDEEEDEEEDEAPDTLPSIRSVNTYELQSNPKGVLERAEKEGTLTLVDDKGEARLLISVFGKD